MLCVLEGKIGLACWQLLHDLIQPCSENPAFSFRLSKKVVLLTELDKNEYFKEFHTLRQVFWGVPV